MGRPGEGTVRACHPGVAMFKLAFAIAVSLSCAAQAAEPTLVSNARIITADATRPFAEAMVYDADGRILALGDGEALRAKYPNHIALDAKGRAIVPGLIDAHGHVLGLGQTLSQVNLVDTASKTEILARLREHAATLPADAWLLGRGWDQNDWPEKVFPTAADLDAAFPDRPVWLERVDGHAAWANSAAMKFAPRALAGDWQPDGGRIERVDGKATGVFVDGAMGLIEGAIPKPTSAMIEQALSKAMTEAARHGLTGVHDAGVSLETLQAYQRLADRGAMPIRVDAMADGDGAALAMLCDKGLYEHDGGHLRMRTVKLYADGALGSRGAALLEDYSDDHGNRGLLVMSEAQLRTAIDKARRCGVQVATHAIGDRANRLVIDLYERALGADASSDHRWRIEHAQIVALADIPRVARLGIIASMQPTHATSDMPWAEQRVGATRIVGGYAWRKFRDAGARLALGSDFPVESVDPLLGLYAAESRQDKQGQPLTGWFANERLTPWEALRGFTLDAAYAGFDEQRVGSLEVGKRADFVILSRDPLTVSPAHLLGTRVMATYVDGKAVYTAEP